MSKDELLFLTCRAVRLRHTPDEFAALYLDYIVGMVREELDEFRNSLGAGGSTDDLLSLAQPAVQERSS